MKLVNIVSQLRAVLPKYTTKFNADNVSITSLTCSGTTVTANSTAHGFSAGDFVLIKGAKIPYAVSSLTRVGTQATVITTAQNQIVYEENGTVEITGATQTDYNGTKTLIEPKKIKISSLTKVGNTITAETEEAHGFVVNANFKINVWGVKEQIYNQSEITIATIPTTTSFTYTVQGETTSPATAQSQIYYQAIYTSYVFFFEVENSPVTPATGTIYQLLSLNQGYNGLHQILTKTDNTFTYTSEYSGLNSPAQGTILANTSRIDSAISLAKAQDAYTPQTTTSYWLFVKPNIERTSKNSRETTDANYVYSNGANYNQTLITTFDVLLFINATGSLAKGDLFDLAQDMRIYIFKSLLGAFLTTDLYESGSYKTKGIIYLEGAPEILDEANAYYVHRFTFEITEDIQQNDIIDEYDSFALRRIQERYIDENGVDTGLDSDVILN